jgi:hypothetical protein
MTTVYCKCQAKGRWGRGGGGVGGLYLEFTLQENVEVALKQFEIKKTTLGKTNCIVKKQCYGT